MKVRTRFSPSPTGMIHLGNARAALFSALYAAKHNGTFILRIEDTDAVRSEERFVESLENDLHWLDIDWQEGPGKHGNFGPYWQSQRQSIYDKYYKILEHKQQIYPCFCSDQELNLARKIQLSRGQAPRYSGTCLKLTAEEIAQKIQAGEKPAWRFKVPANQAIEYIDTVKGPQHFQTDDIGDFVVRRGDGTAPFLFCNAIDDAEMQVSHVLRGEDHVANTPRQILILRALDLPVPHYGHLSLIMGDDGTPLSKRHGSSSVNDIREDGYLPLAVINYLARLGHTLDNQDLLDFDHLSLHFNLEKLSKSPARFDYSQLLYWQKMAVQSLDDDALSRWLGENILNHVPLKMQPIFIKTVKANIEFPKDALMWANIFVHDHLELTPDDIQVLRDAGEQYFVTAELAIDKYGVDLQAVLAEMKSTLGISGKKLFMPLRIALTGKSFGPELAQIAEILGKEKLKHRIGRAFQLTIEKRHFSS